MPESAAEMARQYGLDGKTFRRALRAEGVPWHRLGDRWDPPEGSSEYQEMLRVAERLAGDRSRRTAVRVKTPMQQINRTQYEENIRIFKKRIGDDQCPIWPSEAAIPSGSVPDRFLHYWSPAAGGMFRTRYDMTYPGSPLERLDNETRKR
ncbi:MAG: hypothetical protein OXC91_14080, partial [Rhodobacteraceae bacterium]|nr:hypothetical protein [Paracoccaceae bacterium]